jgi:hypothetical protein
MGAEIGLRGPQDEGAFGWRKRKSTEPFEISDFRERGTVQDAGIRMTAGFEARENE